MAIDRRMLLTGVLLLASACSPAVPGTTSTGSSASVAASPSASSTAASASTSPTEPAPSSAPTASLQPLAGKVVVIDPGHNGANAAHPEFINKPVPDGAGGTKACNTTGTATDAGYPEHELNWQVAIAVRDLLTAQGAQVVLTRPDDAGVGPCVDQRAATGGAAHADAVVSLHGDGAPVQSRGFFCILTPLAPAGPAIAASSASLAQQVRDGILATGVMPVANYEGADGIDASRADLAGLNLSTVPTTMCELGNMRNAADAAVQTSEQGRAALASGVAAGVRAFLGG